MPTVEPPAKSIRQSDGLAAFPDNVRTEMWTDQEDPTPSMATREKGEAFLQRLEERLAEKLQAMIDGRDVTPVPPFHP